MARLSPVNLNISDEKRQQLPHLTKIALRGRLKSWSGYKKALIWIMVRRLA
jgi:hypothetical protein